MWALLSISVKQPIITQTVAVLALLSTGTMDQSHLVLVEGHGLLSYPAKAICNRNSEQNSVYKNKIKQ